MVLAACTNNSIGPPGCKQHTYVQSLPDILGHGDQNLLNAAHFNKISTAYVIQFLIFYIQFTFKYTANLFVCGIMNNLNRASKIYAPRPQIGVLKLQVMSKYSKFFFFKRNTT